MVSGWILGTNALETAETTSSPAKVPKNFLITVTVIKAWANIREAPTTSSNIITTVQEGEEFWLLNKKSNWHQIWHFDLKKRGWISGELIMH